jgi:hypothetical protein
MHKKFWMENSREKTNWGDLDIDGRWLYYYLLHGAGYFKC